MCFEKVEYALKMTKICKNMFLYVKYSKYAERNKRHILLRKI